MQPLYPLTQYPAHDGYDLHSQPASRLEIHQQFLADERQRYVSMLSAQGKPERGSNRPATVVALAFHQGIAWLVSMVGFKGVRRVSTSPHRGAVATDQLCIPGVDC
jgi:hypothetical protein